MRVVLDVQPRDLWIIEEVAQQRGQKFQEYVITQALRSAIETRMSDFSVRASKAERTERVNQIGQMVRAGFDDGAISVKLEITRREVAHTRRELGLKPNSPYGRKKGK